MARYRRKLRIYRGRKKWRRWKKRNLINATSRSRCTIKSRATFSDGLVIAQGLNFSNVMCIHPFAVRGPVAGATAIADRFYPFSTVDQPLVKNFCNLYDEVKIDAVVFKITVTSPVPGANGFDALRVWTGWDRKGTYQDTYYATNVPTPTSVSALPSCNVIMLSNNTINTFYRYCKASDFFEKYCFIDSTQNTVPMHICGVDVPNCNIVESWASGGLTAFSPMFYLCIESVNYAPAANMTVNVAFEMTTYYTFRNPKYGASSEMASTKQQQKTVEVGTAPGRNRIAVPLEDVILDPAATSVRARKRMVDATMLGMTEQEAVGLYNASDPKKYDDTAPTLDMSPPPPQRSRVGLPSTDADLGPPPPAARAAAETAGLTGRPVWYS